METAAPSENILHALDLLKQPRFALGALCIFLYVGAEVAIGSNLVVYLAQPTVWNVPLETAGNYVPCSDEVLARVGYAPFQAA